MEVNLKEVSIKELAKDYKDNAEEGVTGYGGKLDIRPPYQREFVYNSKQREAVIDTVRKGFPLNAMYWSVREDGNYEIIDGQQRTISICQYVNGDFSHNQLFFHNLQDDKQEDILNYKLTIYECSGTNSEKLDWFRIVNIAGEELTDQELRNAVYHGSWVTSAKRHFSKTGCPAFQIGGRYLKGTAIRQDYLETAIKWINAGDIEGYMSVNQHNPNASELWLYFQKVISWIEVYFTTYRSEMKGLPWGDMYNRYCEHELDPTELENQISKLMENDEVTSKKGIYQYVLSGDEKYLSIRAFTNSDKRTVYERQGGICPICKEQFNINEMEADHITPWSEGGKTEISNCQMLCRECNRRKYTN